MKRLGKKRQNSINTIEYYYCQCSGCGCSCYCNSYCDTYCALPDREYVDEKWEETYVEIDWSYRDTDLEDYLSGYLPD